MSSERLSIRKYADRSGVSEGYIRKLIRQGVITKVDGKIDPETADAEWAAARDERYPERRPNGHEAQVDPSGSPGQKVVECPAQKDDPGPASVPEPTAGNVLSQAEAVALKTQWDARLKELQYKEKSRELIDRGEVEQVVTSAMVIVATQLDGLGGRLAQQLAGESDPAVIRQTILDECRRIRATAAEELERLGAIEGDGGGDESAPAEDGGPMGGDE